MAAKAADVATSQVDMTETLLAADHSAARPESLHRARHLALRIWLWTVAAMIFAIVVVGGATRLTESGLSITEWKPIAGVIPPLTHQAWLEEFEKFKQIPQYSAVFSGMDLSGFKVIFFWEFAHRLLARTIGLVFAIPLVIFWLRSMIPQGYKLKLAGVLALGALQGFVGWWMVSSGLGGRIEVAQQRLAIHLLLASLTFAATVYLATRLKGDAQTIAAEGGFERELRGAGLRRFASVMIVVTLVQIFLGGLVAGLRAGRAFNTWPLMDGAFVPSGLFALDPAWSNLVDNIATVQFQHRMVAYLLFGLALVQTLFVLQRAGSGALFRRAAHVFGLVAVQAALGIVTLLLVVPLPEALLHQAFAMVVLAATVRYRARLAQSLEP